MSITNVPSSKACFSASFVNVGDPDEALKVTWTNPDGSGGLKEFAVGSEVFLEDATSASSVPDDQLLACVSMDAILSGGYVPGTKEFEDNMGITQQTKDYQTIVGNLSLESVVSDSNDPDGKTFDLTFKKTNNNKKTVNADVWTVSQYANRASNFTLSSNCVPGAVHLEFGFKKSDLNQQKRQQVVDFINAKKFWI